MNKRAEIKKSAKSCARIDWEDEYRMSNRPMEAMFFSDWTEYSEADSESWWEAYCIEYDKLEGAITGQTK